MLGGGLPRGRVYLIQGPTGSGKTTLSLQFLIEGARAGESSLYIGTSETEEEIRVISANHGWSLDGVTIRLHRPSGSIAEDADIGQTMLLPAEVELPETMKTLRSLIEELEPRRVVVDSVTAFRLLAAQERWYRQQLHSLKELFLQHDCTTMLTEIAQDDPIAETMAHGVIELHHDSRSYGPDRRLLRVLKLRGRSFLTGHHDCRIQTGGLMVYHRLIAAEHRARFEAELISSGLPELDTMLGGGTDRGTSTLLVGPSGAGKSAVSTQFVVAAAERGERSVMYVFDERIQTLFQRSRGIGLPLEEHAESGMVEIRQIDPAEMTPGEFGALVRHAVEKNDVRMVVIDSLNGYLYSMPEERHMGLHLHEMSSYLNQKAVTSMFVITERALHGGADLPVDASYVSDAVIWFRQFEFRGSVHKAVAVHKRRTGPHEKTIRELEITSQGLRVGRPLEQFQGILTGNPRFVGSTLDDQEGKNETG